jgi:hypothetical protein
MRLNILAISPSVNMLLTKKYYSVKETLILQLILCQTPYIIEYPKIIGVKNASIRVGRKGIHYTVSMGSIDAISKNKDGTLGMCINYR